VKIYIAARYDRRQEMVAVVARLVQAGHTVTSSWLAGADDDEPPLALAIWNINDLVAAECCLSFSEAPAARVPWTSRGGRHVELGYALAVGKRLVVVGPRENVFHHLPCVEICTTVEDALQTLSENLGGSP